MKANLKIAFQVIKRSKAINTLLLFFVSLFMFSCALDLEKYGKLEYKNTAGKKSFIFVVEESFYEKYPKTEIEQRKGLSNKEKDLLELLLKKNSYCTGISGVSYQITSKQERVYDMTFARLIEQNYNIKPIVPLKYYGRCK
jgi:hypothetical protein